METAAPSANREARAGGSRRDTRQLEHEAERLRTRTTRLEHQARRALQRNREDLAREASGASGRLSPSFKTAGRLAEREVAVGQSVKAGLVLAREDTSDLQAQAQHTQATLDSQVANDAKVAAAATPEQLAAAATRINAAQTTLDGAQKSPAATRANTASTMASAQADVDSANVVVAADQKTLERGAL